MSESVLLLRLHVVSRRTEPSDELHAVAERLWTADECHGMVVRKPQTRFNGPLPPRPPTRRPWTTFRVCRYVRFTVVVFFREKPRRQREAEGVTAFRRSGPVGCTRGAYSTVPDGGPRPDAVKYVRVYASQAGGVSSSLPPPVMRERYLAITAPSGTFRVTGGTTDEKSALCLSCTSVVSSSYPFFFFEVMFALCYV